MPTYTIIASNGAEVGEDLATWVHVDDEGVLLDQVAYEEGDELADALARFQGSGEVPSGQVDIRREPLSDYWIHEDHPWAYQVTISAGSEPEPIPGERRPWTLEPVDSTPGYMQAVLADEEVREHFHGTAGPGLGAHGEVSGGRRDQAPPEWMRAIARYLDEAGVDYTLD